MRPTAALWTLGVLRLGLLPLASADGDHGSGVPDTFASPMLSQGQSFTAGFTVAAEHPYHCHPHPTMKGRVVVNATAPEGNRTVEIRAFRFLPGAIEVRPGASVTWTNVDGTPHTVTRSDPDEDQSSHRAPGFGTLVSLGAGLMGIVLARLAGRRG